MASSQPILVISVLRKKIEVENEKLFPKKLKACKLCTCEKPTTSLEWNFLQENSTSFIPTNVKK